MNSRNKSLEHEMARQAELISHLACGFRGTSSVLREGKERDCPVVRRTLTIFATLRLRFDNDNALRRYIVLERIELQQPIVYN